MRIAFIDIVREFTAQTVYESPLGGTQSGVCYVSERLAALGHEVFLLTRANLSGPIHGVHQLDWSAGGLQQLQALNLDAAVVIQHPVAGQHLKAMLGERTRVILWATDATWQANMQPLRDSNQRDAFDAIAVLTQWQADEFARDFGIDRARLGLMNLTIAPAFEKMFASDESITAAKQWPPILAYTSTPSRGLDVLLGLFPRIREMVPGATLEVYSSMKVYQTTAETEKQKFGELYDRCRSTPGVDYIGSVPQAELAKRLRRVSVLAYPNTHAETSCVAVMEAMAAGCRIVTSDYGALGETTAGFARLISSDVPASQRGGQFVREVVAAIHNDREHPDVADRELANQIAYVNDRHIWPIRARRWETWLGQITPRPSRYSMAELVVADEITRQARQLFSEGRWAEAENLYRRILQLQPENANLLHSLGLCVLQLHRALEAAELLARAAKLDPSRADFQHNLGLALFDSGRYSEAAAAFEEALVLRPGDARSAEQLELAQARMKN
jgi:glycosyltransferase involved in cell wall biosynthesis